MNQPSLESPSHVKRIAIFLLVCLATPFLLIGLYVSVILIWDYYLEGKSQTQKEFVKKLENEIAEGKTNIPLSELTSFKWDTVCQYDHGLDAVNDLKEKYIDIANPAHQSTLFQIQEASDIWLAVFSYKGVAQEIFYDSSQSIPLNDQKFDIQGYECTDLTNAHIKINQEKSEIWISKK